MAALAFCRFASGSHVLCLPDISIQPGDGDVEPQVKLVDLAKEVSLCHVTKILGDHHQYIKSLLPEWEEADVIQQMFEELEMPNSVCAHETVFNAPAEDKKQLLKQLAKEDMHEVHQQLRSAMHLRRNHSWETL